MMMALATNFTPINLERPSGYIYPLLGLGFFFSELLQEQKWE
jgi:hypothetical protein